MQTRVPCFCGVLRPGRPFMCLYLQLSSLPCGNYRAPILPTSFGAVWAKLTTPSRLTSAAFGSFFVSPMCATLMDPPSPVAPTCFVTPLPSSCCWQASQSIRSRPCSASQREDDGKTLLALGQGAEETAYRQCSPSLVSRSQAARREACTDPFCRTD